MTQNVKFEEDKSTHKKQNHNNTGMAGFLVKYKIVKNAKHASFVLLCATLTLLLITLFIVSDIQQEKERKIQPDPETVL